MLEQPGAERVTTAALAARLEVSEAALYRHFASKAQMFEGLIEFIETSVFTLVNQIVEREPSGSAQAQKIATVLLQFGEKNPGMTRVMVGDALVFEHERLTARMGQFFDRVESQLRQSLRLAAEAAGSATPTVDAQALASALDGAARRPPAALRALGLQAAAHRAPRTGAAAPHQLSARRLELMAGGTAAAAAAAACRLPAGAAHAAGGRRAPGQGGVLPAPGRAGAGSHHRRDAAAAGPGLSPPPVRGSVVFLGDLLHSARARAEATMAAVARWRERHASLALTLVRGNHDSHAGDPPADWGVTCVDGPLLLGLGGLALAHHPQSVPGRYVLAGHLHPAAVRRRPRRATACACPAFTSAPRWACCRPSAPSPACT